MKTVRTIFIGIILGVILCGCSIFSFRVGWAIDDVFPVDISRKGNVFETEINGRHMLAFLYPYRPAVYMDPNPEKCGVPKDGRWFENLVLCVEIFDEYNWRVQEYRLDSNFFNEKNPERGQLASNFADEYPSTGYKTSIVNSLLKIPADQEPPGYHQWWLWRSVELYHGDAYKVRIKVISPAKKEKTLYLLTALKIG